MHLDPLMHEVPRLVPFGPWDDLDSDEVEEWDWLQVRGLPVGNSLRGCTWRGMMPHGMEQLRF